MASPSDHRRAAPAGVAASTEHGSPVRSAAQTRASSVVLLLALVASLSASQGIDAQLHKDPVPSELAAPIGGAMATGGVRAVVGGVTLDLWFVKALELGATPAAWAAIDEGALVGAVRLGADVHDRIDA